MSVISDEVTGIFVGFLYTTDWNLLSDSGLTTDQLAAYATLRANLNTVTANATAYTDDNLTTALTASLAAYTDMEMRYPDFTDNMTAFQSALTTLIGG
jgi:hypothetical protein